MKKEEEEEEKINRTAKPGKKKSKVVKSCGWVLFVGPLCAFNYNIAIELWVMETENSQKLFLVSITHNSKIRELSDGNRVIVCQITFLLWISQFLNYKLWKLRIELSKEAIQTTPISPKLDVSSPLSVNGVWKVENYGTFKLLHQKQLLQAYSQKLMKASNLDFSSSNLGYFFF